MTTRATASGKGASRWTNLEWIRTLSAEELSDWFYDEWLGHMQYAWASSRKGLEHWLNENTADTPQTEKSDSEYYLELADAVMRGEMSDASANQAWYEYINKKDTPQTERFDSTHDPHKEWTDCGWK